MKTLENLLKESPSYSKWGTERLATKTGLKVSTVVKFKRSSTYKQLLTAYKQGLA